MARTIRVVTYNTHKSRGMDGRIRPERIVEVLREVEPDIVALQEVLSIDDAGARKHQANYFAEELGMHMRLGETRRLRGGAYGNVILSRFPLGEGLSHDLSVRWGRERRGCLRVDVELPDKEHLHVYNVHLGTGFRERRHQGPKLVETLLADRPGLRGPRVVLGDFNEWTAGLTSRLLAARLNSVDIGTHLHRKKTYPGLLPVLHLDHIYFDDALALEGLRLHRTRKALLASDHLPLVADFQLGAGKPA
jgi:endonuclease/exonuclease/phosphatase family metal-dependent hydrolase